MYGITVVYSFAGALFNPGLGTSVTARAAEWVRENGGSNIVVWVENQWYSHHQPPIGGKPPAGEIVRVGHTPTATSGGPGLPPPNPISPLASPSLPGEGQWTPAGRLVQGVPAIYETRMRPDALHTSQVVGVAWMDTKLLKATLYSGSQIPGGGPYPNTAPILPSAAQTLDAAFNAGFLLSDSNGGYFTNGQTVAPLRDGAASLVIYKNGSVTVGQWGRDVNMTSSVVSVRQNLNLLVDNGAPVPDVNSNNPALWGNTLGGQDFVWRSAIGETLNGALVYVGGPSLDVASLAKLLAHAGAFRGMELDINTDWVDFAAFAPSAGTAATPATGVNLLPTMVGSPARYFATWWTRDFFTMSAR